MIDMASITDLYTSPQWFSFSEIGEF